MISNNSILKYPNGKLNVTVAKVDFLQNTLAFIQKEPSEVLARVSLGSLTGFTTPLKNTEKEFIWKDSVQLIRGDNEKTFQVELIHRVKNEDDVILGVAEVEINQFMQPPILLEGSVDAFHKLTKVANVRLKAQFYKGNTQPTSSTVDASKITAPASSTQPQQSQLQSNQPQQQQEQAQKTQQQPQTQPQQQQQSSQQQPQLQQAQQQQQPQQTTSQSQPQQQLQQQQQQLQSQQPGKVPVVDPKKPEQAAVAATNASAPKIDNKGGVQQKEGNIEDLKQIDANPKKEESKPAEVKKEEVLKPVDPKKVEQQKEEQKPIADPKKEELQPVDAKKVEQSKEGSKLVADSKKEELKPMDPKKVEPQQKEEPKPVVDAKKVEQSKEVPKNIEESKKEELKPVDPKKVEQSSKEEQKPVVQAKKEDANPELTKKTEQQKEVPKPLVEPKKEELKPVDPKKAEQQKEAQPSQKVEPKKDESNKVENNKSELQNKSLPPVEANKKPGDPKQVSEVDQSKKKEPIKEEQKKPSAAVVPGSVAVGGGGAVVTAAAFPAGSGGESKKDETLKTLEKKQSQVPNKIEAKPTDSKKPTDPVVDPLKDQVKKDDSNKKVDPLKDQSKVQEPTNKVEPNKAAAAAQPNKPTEQQSKLSENKDLKKDSHAAENDAAAKVLKCPDKYKYQIIIKSIKGNFTRSTDMIGKMDPYVKIRINEDQQLKTTVKEGGGNQPVWTEQFVMLVELEENIKFSVYDSDIDADDLVGEGFLKVSHLREGEDKRSIPLEFEKKPAGTLTLEIMCMQNILFEQLNKLKGKIMFSNITGEFTKDTSNAQIKFTSDIATKHTFPLPKSGKTPAWTDEIIGFTVRDPKSSVISIGLNSVNKKGADIIAVGTFDFGPLAAKEKRYIKEKIALVGQDKKPFGSVFVDVAYTDFNAKEDFVLYKLMQVEGKIRIKNMKAILTRDTDTFGKMDPYCVMDYNGMIMKTAVHKSGGKQPVWKEANFEQTVFSYQKNKLMKFDVFEEDSGSADDFVGGGVLDFTPMLEKPGKYLGAKVEVSFEGKSAGVVYLDIETEGNPEIAVYLEKKKKEQAIEAERKRRVEEELKRIAEAEQKAREEEAAKKKKAEEEEMQRKQAEADKKKKEEEEALRKKQEEEAKKKKEADEKERIRKEEELRKQKEADEKERIRKEDELRKQKEKEKQQKDLELAQQQEKDRQKKELDLAQQKEAERKKKEAEDKQKAEEQLQREKKLQAEKQQAEAFELEQKSQLQAAEKQKQQKKQAEEEAERERKRKQQQQLDELAEQERRNAEEQDRLEQEEYEREQQRLLLAEQSAEKKRTQRSTSRSPSPKNQDYNVALQHLSPNHGLGMSEFQSATSFQKSSLAYSIPKNPRFGVASSRKISISNSPSNSEFVQLPSIFDSGSKKGVSFGVGRRSEVVNMSGRHSPGPGAYQSSETSPKRTGKGCSFGVSRDNCRNIVDPSFGQNLNMRNARVLHSLEVQRRSVDLARELYKESPMKEQSKRPNNRYRNVDSSAIVVALPKERVPAAVDRNPPSSNSALGDRGYREMPMIPMKSMNTSPRRHPGRNLRAISHYQGSTVKVQSVYNPNNNSQINNPSSPTQNYHYRQ